MSIFFTALVWAFRAYNGIIVLPGRVSVSRTRGALSLKAPLSASRGAFKKRAPRFRETDTLPGRTIMPLLHLGNYGCLSFNYMAAYPTLHNHVPVDKNDVSCQGPAGRAPFGSGGKVT